jgi:hypothetical protein
MVSPETSQTSLPRRNLLICGLHRSGTSLITRSLAAHPQITGFHKTGTIEDEGQFLQTVMPLEIVYGSVGRFGFDPRAHLTESSILNTPENGRKLLSEWSRHWDMSRPVRVEKTPSNLLRMRLLNRLLEPARFVIVTRHPVAACLATLKWTEGGLFSLLSHWVHCYRIARDDAASLPHVIWTSYEAFVARPEQELNRLLQFAGLEPAPSIASALQSENEKYFRQWRELYFGDGERAIAQKPPVHYRSPVTRLKDRIAREQQERALPLYRRQENLRNHYEALDAASLLEPAIAEFGYSFTDFGRAPNITPGAGLA